MIPLKNLRQQIDDLDKQLLTILKERLQTVAEIGKTKKQLKMPALQPKRWQEVIDSRLQIAQKLGLERNFIKQIFNLIHAEALKIERKI